MKRDMRDNARGDTPRKTMVVMREKGNYMNRKHTYICIYTKQSKNKAKKKKKRTRTQTFKLIMFRCSSKFLNTTRLSMGTSSNFTSALELDEDEAAVVVALFVGLVL
jgi:hypothetical protein